jgi:glutathionylspermidine synthase
MFALSSPEYQTYLQNPDLSFYELCINIHKKYCRYIYYIGNKQLTLKEYKKQSKNIVGYIETIVDYDESIITISYLHTTTRSKGFGTFLIVISVLNSGVKTVELDDMSDNFGKVNNIYKKMGLEYVQDGMPEMTGSVSKIKDWWGVITSKYL